MPSCTFFGHSDAPYEIESTLKSKIIDLISDKKVNTFYVGNNGNFDKMVQKILSDLSKQYIVKSYVVLAYLPDKYSDYKLTTLFPEEIELVPPKFAISYRNKWMIEKADYVITYVAHSFGGAYKAKTLAEKKKKITINIIK